VSVVRDVILRIRVDAPGLPGIGNLPGAGGLGGAPSLARGGGPLVGPGGGFAGVPQGAGAAYGLGARGGGSESLKRLASIPDVLRDIERSQGRVTAGAYRWAHALGLAGYEMARLATWSRIVTRVTYGAQELGLGGTAFGGAAAIGAALGLGIVGGVEWLQGNVRFGQPKRLGGPGVVYGPTISAMGQEGFGRAFGAEYLRSLLSVGQLPFNIIRQGGVRRGWTQPTWIEDLLVEAGAMPARGMAGLPQNEAERVALSMQQIQRQRQVGLQRGATVGAQWIAPRASQLTGALAMAELQGAARAPIVEAELLGTRQQLGRLQAILPSARPDIMPELQGEIRAIMNQIVELERQRQDLIRQESAEQEQSLHRRLSLVQQIEASERSRAERGIVTGYGMPRALQRRLAEAAGALEGGRVTQQQVQLLMRAEAPVTEAQWKIMLQFMAGRADPMFLERFELEGGPARETARIRRIEATLRGVRQQRDQELMDSIHAQGAHEQAANAMDTEIENVSRERSIEYQLESGKKTK